MTISKHVIATTHFRESIIEPDGSIWKQVFFHNNPSENLFSSSDTFSTGVYKDENMWLDFGICKSLDKFEFLVIQSPTGSAVGKVRWIQTKSPFISTYDDVKPSAVTRITTSGYADAGTTYGGGLYVLNSNTYMVIANTTNGNWWGATGSWTNYQGGIPGAGRTVVSTGFIAIYVRIDNTNHASNTAIVHKTGKMFDFNELIED